MQSNARTFSFVRVLTGFPWLRGISNYARQTAKKEKNESIEQKRENKLRREKERGQIKNGSSTHRNVK